MTNGENGGRDNPHGLEIVLPVAHFDGLIAHLDRSPAPSRTLGRLLRAPDPWDERLDGADRELGDVK